MKKVISLLVALVILVLPCLVVPVVQAAVISDSSSSASTGSNTAQTLSWSHTANGTDRIVVVGVSINANTAVSSVTYGGLPLTKIVAYESGNAVRASLWYLINPPTGLQTVRVNMSATARFVAGAHSYTGVNQQIPLGTPAVSRGTSMTSASLNVLSNTNEIVVDVFVRRGDLTSNPITAGSGQTSRWNTRTTVNNNSSGVTGGGSSKVGALSTTMSWSWPSKRAWAIAGVSLKPSSPPPDTTPPLRSNGLPSGTLPAGITQTTISLQTNENATCRYSTSLGFTYLQMTNTFSVTGGTAHSQLITGLNNGSSYSFYVRCTDALDNRNGDDFSILFSVDTPPTST